MDDISSLASTALVALFSAWAGVWFSLKRFKSEKRWEKKTQAYENIIEALHFSKIYLDTHLDALYEQKTLNQEYSDKLRDDSMKASKALRRIVDVGALIISDEAITRLTVHQEELSSASRSNDFFDYLDHSLAATASCLKDLIPIAKRDLKIK